VLPTGELAPGATVTNVVLRFNNPNRVSFTFTHRVMGTVAADHTPPVANAGPDQTALVGDTVTLDGSGSTDVDGDVLTYAWSFMSKPERSAATLSDRMVVKPAFTVDKVGDYVVQLIVSDGELYSTPDTVTISTVNSAPVANAGPDQSVVLGTLVILDGGDSTDVDGDPLTYRWTLETAPDGSGATLQDANTATPSFTVDKAGIYRIALVVRDGTVDSEPDPVVVTTLNSRPVANAGLDQTVLVGQTVTLSGALSSDADGDPLTYGWSFTTKPEGSQASLTDPTAIEPTFTAEVAGLYVVQLIVDDGEEHSVPDTVGITAESPPPANQPPVITSMPPLEATVGQLYRYPVVATDPDDDPLTYGLENPPAGMTIDDAGSIAWTPGPTQVGGYTITVTVSDGQSAPVTQRFTLSVREAPVAVPVPDVVGKTREEAETLITQAEFTVGAVTEAASAIVPAGKVISQNPAAGVAVAKGTAVNLIVSSGPGEVGPLPPDPATIAPPIDPTVATTTYAATEFLYTGANPIQTGVAPGTIEERRVAVIRGKVLDRAGNPLPGVAITILNHPEFGQTLSRADGAFDLAVNGGGYLVVNYQRAGYLPAQRRLDVPWQDYALVDDVVLIQLDPNVTAIDLPAPIPFQVARGSVVTDQDGSRQATLLFPQGVEARIYDAAGHLQPITTLNFRATEYTVGDNGPQAMPGDLPPTVAYTYAVELSVDEATRKVDGKDVLFSQPVPMYLENFLNVGVGAIVPVGFYDRDKAAWVPDYDGRVVKILSIVDGVAQLDTVGDGAVDNGVDLGVTEAERRQLAGLYGEGQSLWRAPLSHLSTSDLNFPPLILRNPSQESPEQPTSPIGCTLTQQSAIECQNQILHEDVAVAGTPFDLHYASDRTPGRLAANRLKIYLSGPSLPTTRPLVWRILLKIDVAGRRFEYQYPAEPNLTHEFVWDGKDALGRTLQGKQPITVTIGWAYTDFYGQPLMTVASGGSRSFGMASSGPLAGDVITRIPTYATQIFKTTIGAWDAQTAGLGGWTLNDYHAYDPVGRTLYLGDGLRRSVEDMNNAAMLDARVDAVKIRLGADGSRYTYGRTNRGVLVHRIDNAGNTTLVAGGGTLGCEANNVPATDIWIGNSGTSLLGFAVGPDV
jgi:hypothetical protein